MSYLHLPRLTFIGESYSNPSTGNNNDLADIFDVDTLQIRRQPKVIDGANMVQPPNNTSPWTGPADNGMLREWMMGFMTLPSNIEAGDQGQPAHWNYYGDHATEFRNTTVNSIVMPDGLRRVEDALMCAKVEIVGDVYYEARRSPVIVDVDPYALVTSQIFLGGLRVSHTIDGKQINLIEGDRPTRAYSYHIYPFKNLDSQAIGFQPVSAIFIFGLPKEHLGFGPANTSSALDALRKEAEAGQGLQVRFCFYDAIYDLQPRELHDRFMRGEFVFNPYKGRVLGTIGPWGNNELASAPPGRKLYLQKLFDHAVPATPLIFARTPPGAIRHYYRSPTEVQRERAARLATKKIMLGPALAVVDRKRQVVTLDLISTVPEVSVGTLEKLNLGDLVLRLTNGDQFCDLGPVRYQKTPYEQGGGVAEVSYAENPELDKIEKLIDNGRLELFSLALHQTLLSEVCTFDVQTDDRAVYFEEKVERDGGPVAGTAEITIQVFERGRPRNTQTVLNLEYWMCMKDFTHPSKPQVAVPTKYFDVDGAMSQTPTKYPHPLDKTLPPLQVITERVVIPAGENGRLTLKLSALRPGVSMIRFVDPAIQPPPEPNFAWDNTDYAIVRILPFEDYSGYSDETINSWEFIYEHFFSYFSIMYPVMSKVVPWGPANAPNDPAEVKKLAEALRNFTSEDMWPSTLYMPISRDMSAGKRKLLHRWCNLQM